MNCKIPSWINKIKMKTLHKIQIKTLYEMKIKTLHNKSKILQHALIGRPPPGTQDNIMNQIERVKNEVEALICRLKAYGQTNPMRT